MKHYLLTFNHDWADEHNVPALACFTQEEYDTWLKTTNGKVNKNYLVQKAHYDRVYKEYYDYHATLSALYKKDPEQLARFQKETKQPKYPSDRPKQGTSFIHANLGNSGDGFDENFEGCSNGQDLVDKKFVKVFEVDESFKKVFDTARLANLSLSNVFDMDFDDWDEEEEEGDESED